MQLPCCPALHTQAWQAACTTDSTKLAASCRDTWSAVEGVSQLQALSAACVPTWLLLHAVAALRKQLLLLLLCHGLLLLHHLHVLQVLQLLHLQSLLLLGVLPELPRPWLQGAIRLLRQLLKAIQAHSWQAAVALAAKARHLHLHQTRQHGGLLLRLQHGLLP